MEIIKGVLIERENGVNKIVSLLTQKVAWKEYKTDETNRKNQKSYYLKPSISVITFNVNEFHNANKYKTVRLNKHMHTYTHTPKCCMHTKNQLKHNNMKD